MRFRIFYHDRCFDGAASAALLSRFIEDCYYPQASLLFQGLPHSPNFAWRPQQFDGDENAIVDFRYCPYPCVTWWFDHHQSAFLSAEDEQHFRQTRSEHKVLDTTFPSCAGLIAESVLRSHGYCAPDLRRLVEWADIIDGAKYPNAQAAVDLELPANRLKLVLEQAGNPADRELIVKKLRSIPFDEVLADGPLKSLAEQLCEQQVRSTNLLRSRAEHRHATVFVDLTSLKEAHFNKFMPYQLFPDVRYVVCLTRAAQWLKISLGSNPWKREGCSRNLATLAERFGGGGHPNVAGITLQGFSIDQARALASKIVDELRSATSTTGAVDRRKTRSGRS